MAIMIPPDYLTYFTSMAAVGATLFGLIFVAISIVPESVANPNAPLEHQISATTSCIALLNPLIISLFALVPHQQIGIIVISLGLIGLLNSLVVALTWLQNAKTTRARYRHSLFILAGFILYGYETYLAIRLQQSPADIGSLNALTDLLILVSIFGVIRAWELIGIRQFHLMDWLYSNSPKERNPNWNAVDSAAGEMAGGFSEAQKDSGKESGEKRKEN